MNDGLLPPDPFAPDGPEGRVLFSQLVYAFVDAARANDLAAATSGMSSGVAALSDDDLRRVVTFAVGMEAARQLGLLTHN